MKILTTLDDQIACRIVCWPPKQTALGHWQIEVQEMSFVLNSLHLYYGRDFVTVDGHRLCQLISIERERFASDDETETAAMIFVRVEIKQEPTCCEQPQAACS